MTDKTDMDLDGDSFGDFGENEYGIMALAYEEQMQQQRPQLPTQQHTPNVHSKVPNRQDPSARPPMVETTAEESEKSTNAEGYGPEAERIIASLRFQIRRLELSSTPVIYEESHHAKELLHVKEALKDKDLEIVELKHKLNRYRSEEPTDGPKRSFPGVNAIPNTKPAKSKKSKKAMGMYAQMSQAFSSRASTPVNSTQNAFQLPASSQSTSFEQQASQSQAYRQQSIAMLPGKLSQLKKSVPSLTTNTENMSKLASRLEPLALPPNNIPNRPAPIVNSVNSRPITKAPSGQTKSHQSPSAKKKKTGHGKRHKPNESEENNRLLILLFTPLFQQWNLSMHNNTKDIHVVLTPARIQQFSVDFSKQFIPDPTQCSPAEYEKLKLLASDISSHLIKSEYASGTIRMLLDIFQLTIEICIREKLYIVIERITMVVKKLVAISLARDYMYKDFIHGKNAILLQFVNAFALFPLKDPERSALLIDNPDIAKKSMQEVEHVSRLYGIPPTKIKKALQKTPRETSVIVKSILEIFYSIGVNYPRHVWNTLMWDRNFLKYLKPNRPYEIIVEALRILETNFKDPNYIPNYKDKGIELVIRLSTLVATKNGSLASIEWNTIRKRSLKLIQSIVQLENPVIVLSQMHKEILQSMDIMFGNLFDDFKKIQSSGQTKQRAISDRLTMVGFQTLYMVIKDCPTDVFCLEEAPTPKKVIQLTDFFKKYMPPTHPVHKIFLLLEQHMDKYFEEERRQSSQMEC